MAASDSRRTYFCSSCGTYVPRQRAVSSVHPELCEDYIQTARELYIEKKISREEFEQMIETLLSNELAAREFRGKMKDKYGISTTRWIPDRFLEPATIRT